MLKYRLVFFCLSACLFASLTSSAQIKGLFEKEEPVFHVAMQPTGTAGTVKMIVHYTHSKAASLKTSFWVNDRGAGLMNTTSPNRMIVEMYEMSNRRPDTILVEGLADQHFYTIGVDYLSSSVLSSKFVTKVIESTYKYEYKPQAALAAAPVNPAASAQMTPRSVAAPPPPPCVQPELLAWIDRKDYCGDDKLPAVVLQCANCYGQNWTYTVSYRTDFAGWRPLATHAQPKASTGNAAIVEALCDLPPGFYYFNVTARGEHCTEYISIDIPTPVAVSKPAKPQPAAANNRPQTPPSASAPVPVVAPLPEKCSVSASAALIDGSQIRGYVSLPANSPCTEWQAQAVVRYVHPGHRDLEARPITLLAGQDLPYSIQLDPLDRARQIHTLQVIVYITPKEGGAPIALESFWLKATEPDIIAGNVLAPRPTQTAPATPAQQVPAQQTPAQQTPAQQAPASSTPDEFAQPEQPRLAVKTPAPAATPTGEPMNTPEVEALNAQYESLLMSEEFETINVKASNPNCNQVQDLQVVFVPNDPGKPLYISWLSPRCCQEEGCKYTVWAGTTPGQLRLIVEGSKRGAIVRELLQDLQPEDLYVEVEVNTPHGKRKAGYVLDEGPLYGIEEIMAFRDRTKPPTSDAIPMVRGDLAASTDMVPDLAPRSVSQPTAAPGLPPVTKPTPLPRMPAYVKPNMPATGFSPCAYRRETLIIGDQPISDGDLITIKYNYSDPAYQFTLYHKPPNATEWTLAPGSTELQPSPEFDLVVTPYTAGQYVVMAYKPANKWGCLATPLNEALEIKIAD